VAAGMNIPWIVGGDFNVVLNTEEKIGGLPMVDVDHEEFECCISACELKEVQFK